VRQPFVLVYEEAHNYLPRRDRRGRMFARDAVEKVAKEGRKYGVSAMVVSQRPSEISETILSQCNSMVLMRMNNPDDQNYAARVVSDQFRSLISLLPSMRPGEAFIIGDAVLMPMRTLIDMPPKLPRSGDVDFFGLWARGTASSEDERDAAQVDQIIDRWWRQDRSAVVHCRKSREVSLPVPRSKGLAHQVPIPYHWPVTQFPGTHVQCPGICTRGRHRKAAQRDRLHVLQRPARQISLLRTA